MTVSANGLMNDASLLDHCSSQNQNQNLLKHNLDCINNSNTSNESRNTNNSNSSNSTSTSRGNNNSNNNNNNSSNNNNYPSVDDLPPFGQQYYYTASEEIKNDVMEEISGVIASAVVFIQQQLEQQEQSLLPLSPIFDSPLTPQGLLDDDQMVPLSSTIITTTTSNDEMQEEVDFKDNDADDDDGDSSGRGGVGITHDDFVMNLAASNDGKETDGDIMEKKSKTIPNFISWERQDLSYLVAPNTSMSSSLQGQPSMVMSPASCCSGSVCSSSSIEEGNGFDDRLFSLSRSSSESSVATTATNMATIAPIPPVSAPIPLESESMTMPSVDNSNSDPNSNKTTTSRSVKWFVRSRPFDRHEIAAPDDNDNCNASRSVKWVVGLVNANLHETHATDENGNCNVMFYLSRLETVGTASTTHCTLHLKGPEMIQQLQSMDESSSSCGRRRRRSRNDKKFLICLPGSTCLVLKDAVQAVRAVETEMAAVAVAERQLRRQPRSSGLGGTNANGGFRSRRFHFWLQLKKFRCPLLGESRNSVKSDASAAAGHHAARRPRTWSSSAAQAEVANGDSDCLHL
jgi:hypothetical protein